MDSRIKKYQQEYLDDYAFEAILVGYRQKVVLERLCRKGPRTVLEIGCGANLVCEKYHQQGGTADRWLIVEPGDEFCARAAKSTAPNVTVIQGFVEDSPERIRSQLDAPPDFILCSSVLHEVPDPQSLLAAVTGLMGPNTTLHVNVPNASSMHRRLAAAMGLITDLKSMSDRNKKLMQHRVYDRRFLAEQLASFPLVVEAEGGYFIKPFTHAQMSAVANAIGVPVLDGLFELGRQLPELASEIYVEARRA